VARHHQGSARRTVDYFVDWQRLKSDGVLEVTVWGRVEAADAKTLEALMGELEAAAMLGSIRILVDAMLLDLGLVTSDHRRSLAQWWRETQALGGSTVAVVVPSDPIFGLNRMPELGACIGSESPFCVFRTRSEGFEWLGVGGSGVHRVKP
jgi:hypothetical protein